MKIPIPESIRLKKEIEADLEAVTLEFFESGLSLKESREKANSLFNFNSEEIYAIEATKNTWIYKLASKYKLEFSKIELMASFLPTVGLIYYMHKEVPMFNLMYQGGIFSWVLMSLGIIGVMLQLRLLFSWFVAKNHYDNSFNKSAKLPLKLGLVCFLFGILGTALGLFIVLAHMPDVPAESFRNIIVTGLKESMVNLVLGTAVLSVIYSLHTLISELSRKDGLPISVNIT